MAIEGKDPQSQVPPDRIEPDLTPAPGTKADFDKDSPDLADPMQDPNAPAKPPAGPVDDSHKRGEGSSYPPYDGEPE